MKVRIVLSGGLLALALACGGMGGGAVGEYASGYADYVSSDAGIPAPAYGLGDEVTVGDFTFVFEGTDLADAETSLPWIENHEERTTFARDGTKALVVKYKVKNDAPVKQKIDVYFVVMGTDGERAPGGSYNSRLYQEDHGLVEPQDDKLAAGTWIESASVHSIAPGAADGAAAHLRRWEERKDARGKKERVLVEQAVVDLGAPGEAPHINPEKR